MFSNDDLTENFKILATDDEKIKSFGEIFTNDSSREILQLLFNEELSATQIAQKTDISLQLVKYHLAKLQSLDVVKISRIEKNSKSQDMKIYTAMKFSIVIVPPTLSEKTRESKSLARSFRHIYKVAGLGIATGISGLFSLSQMPRYKQIPTDAMMSGEMTSTQESAPMLDSSKPVYDEPESFKSAPMLESKMDGMDSENLEFGALEIVDTVVASDDAVLSASELHLGFAILSVILGGLTIYCLYGLFKKTK